MKLDGNTILVTGGGSGIGEALAHRFHDLGNIVVIVGREKEELEKAAEGRPNIHAVVIDLDDKEAIERFGAKVIKDFPALNILFNNAGITRFEELDRTRDLADTEASVTTNLLAPIRLINALIDHFVAQSDAAIVNTTSGLAYVPLVAAPAYGATKAAIHSYTVALREALKGRVEVVEVVPGPVATKITAGQDNLGGNQPLHEFIDEVLAQLGQQPTPSEILVDRSRGARFAERDGTFDHMLHQINAGG